MKPESVGYLATIRFEISTKEFLDLVDELDFKKTSLEECRFRNIEMRIAEGDSLNRETTLCFEKDENLVHCHFGTKYLVYDTETMTAYYEYMNYKGIYR